MRRQTDSPNWGGRRKGQGRHKRGGVARAVQVRAPNPKVLERVLSIIKDPIDRFAALAEAAERSRQNELP